MTTRVGDVCRSVRSKNAGPFWITVDLFFDGPETYARFADHPAIGVEALAALYGVDPARVKRFKVDDLAVVKLSYPRPAPQGGALERDLHGGQQFVPLLGVELD
jgi:hypothetical protein